MTSTKSLLSDYALAVGEKSGVARPIILTFSPCGSVKTLSFMKWLGVAFPRWLENELQFAKDPLEKSLELTGSDSESWQWQLPDIKPGQLISFRLVEAPIGSGVPPQLVRPRDPKQVEENRREARKAYAKAKRDMVARKRKRA